MIYCIAKQKFFTRGNKAENPISQARLANQNIGQDHCILPASGTYTR